jgi:SAM-dependent methyltransferase
MDVGALARYFEKVKTTLQDAYMSHDEPWRQSGMSGPEERWVSLRKPIADCVDQSGSFLDIGCANGYLLECVAKWVAERGLSIEGYGLDLSERLVALARQRLPEWTEHFFVGNSWEWQPPRRFDYVRSELVYVPAEYERPYLERLAVEYLAPGGRLLIPNYMEDDLHPERGLFPENYPTRHILDRLAELGVQPVGYHDGYDPIKGRHIRVAVLTHESVFPAHSALPLS